MEQDISNNTHKRGQAAVFRVKANRKLRKKLLETEIMREKGDKLEFAEDAIFSSPSAAANMVLGRNSNGFTEWITETGKTFKQIQDEINE